MLRTANPDPAARHALLRAATKLMLARGFSATSVDDICQGAGLTKGSLFHYFATKEDLGIAVLDQYLVRVFAKMDAVRANEQDPLARVYACLKFLSEAAETYPLSQGCILGRFTQELAQTHPRVRAKCDGYFDQWINFVASDLEEANRVRRLGRKDTRSLAEYALASFEGALILAKASGDPGVVRRTLDHAQEHLERMFEPKAGSRRRRGRAEIEGRRGRNAKAKEAG